MAGGGRVNGILEQLACVLNSSEQFEMDDSLQLAFVHVRSPPRGHGKRKMKPGHRHPETFKRIKTSVVTINNKDDLCAARAIVTAKAKTDGNPHWKKVREGRPIQYEQALLLHLEVDVPFGLCGYPDFPN